MNPMNVLRIASLAALVSIASGAASRASAEACMAGGAVACNTCQTSDVAAPAAFPVSGGTYSWYDFDNRTASRGGTALTDFSCPGTPGDLCWWSPASGQWLIAAGDWGNAQECRGAQQPARTAVLVEGRNLSGSAEEAGGWVAFLIASDNAGPSAYTDLAPNLGRSSLAPIVRPVLIPGSKNNRTGSGPGCASQQCMQVTLALPELDASAFAKIGGAGLLGRENRGWAVYELKATSTLRQGIRSAEWVLAAKMDGSPATQTVAAGSTISLRTTRQKTAFALAPVFGGSGLSCRGIGVASNTPDSGCAAAETTHLGTALVVASNGAVTASADELPGDSAPLLSNEISWTAVAGLETAGFAIYRSTGTTGWVRLGADLVPVERGRALGEYTYTDRFPRQWDPSEVRYRIEQVGTDGGVVDTPEPEGRR